MKENERVCNLCGKKDPPVRTILIPGINVSKRRYKRSDYVCDDCYKARSKGYGAQYRQKMKRSDQILEIHRQQLDVLYEQASAHKDLADKDRIYYTWADNERRWPEKGARANFICEVFWPSLWNADPLDMADEHLDKHGVKPAERRSARPILVRFLSDPEYFGFRQQAGRAQARKKFQNAIYVINKEHKNEEKMVSGIWHDPDTGERIRNWYLLSRQQECDERTSIREAKKLSIDETTKEEQTVVNYRVNKEIQERNEKSSGEPEA